MRATAVQALMSRRRLAGRADATGWSLPAHTRPQSGRAPWIAQALELDIKTPKDYRSYAERLKVGFDNINRSAGTDQAWRSEYSAFGKFYADVLDASWWTLSDTTYEELREWERRLADWQGRFKAKGLDVGPQVVPPGRGSSTKQKVDEVVDSIGSVVKLVAVAGAVYAAAKYVGGLRG